MLSSLERMYSLEEEREMRVREQAARAEAEAARDRIANILESMTDAFMALDRDWRVAYLNQRAEQLLNRRREDLVGKNIWTELPGVTDSDLYSHCTRAMAEQVRVQFKEFNASLDRWLEVNVYPFRDGLAIHFRDVTESEQTVEALKVSEALKVELLNLLPMAAYTCDAEGLITSYNRIASQLWGREPRLGHPDERFCGAFRLHLPDGTYLPHSECPMAHVLKSNSPVSDREVVIERPDGSFVHVLVSISPIRDNNGKLVGAVNCFQDITERKQAQEQETETRLQFLSVLTHELRTPLAPLLTSGTMLREVLNPDPASIQGRLLNNIIKGAEVLRDRVNELLDITAFQAGKYRLEYETFNVKDAVEDLCDYLAAEAMSKRQQLVLELAEALPRIRADRRRFQQVLSNLLLNAMKFSPEGLPICVRIWVQGEMLVVEVEDRGPGISAEEQARLFQPYFRVEQDRQRFPGLGLGLALSRQIVEAHGGWVWLDSSPGKGSRFFFSLPVRPARATRRPDVAARKGRQANGVLRPTSGTSATEPARVMPQARG